MSGYVFFIGAISYFLGMRVLFFNYEMKRSPTGFKDFKSYKMRKFTTFLCLLLSIIVLAIGYPKSGASTGFNFFTLCMLIVFLFPIVYIIYLIKKDADNEHGRLG